MENYIIERLKDVKEYNQVYKIPRSIYLGKRVSKEISSLNVGFVVDSCFGFGDVIFTYKLFTYFKKWYNITPMIFTTKPKLFTQFVPKGQLKLLGVPGEPLEERCDYRIGSMVAYEFEQGRRKRYKSKKPFDCMFITPWVGNNNLVNHEAIKNIFPETSKFNTFVFSAYNRVKEGEKSLFDFEMGLGDDSLGLLYTKWGKECGKRPIKNPYIISYVADIEEVNGLKCFEKFIKTVVSKYHDIHDKLEILVPESLTEDGRLDSLLRYIEREYSYDNIIISRSPKETKSAQRKRGSYLLFRTDVKNVPYLKYLNYICNALPDILVTGNQSVSDILSCCPDFNIFYQIMPWEKNFAKELSKLTGVEDLGVVSKSCGHNEETSLKGISKSNDFEKKGKKYMDAVLGSVLGIKTSEFLGKFVESASRSRKVNTLLKKFSSTSS
jgi:hypothetical protein